MSKIREAARDEDCLVRLPGVCCFDPAKSIWSHAKWASGGKGRGLKAIDLAGAIACTSCDAVYDGQAKPPPGMTRDEIDLAWFHGHLRSLVRLKEKGIIK